MDILANLLVICGLHLGIAMTPGPNTLAICCVASAGTRRDGLWVAAGVVAATGLWVGLALLSVGAALAQDSALVTGLRIAAAVYLMGSGLRMLASSPARKAAPVGGQPFLMGLLTALANPLALAFWLGTFLAAIPAPAPRYFYAEIFTLIILQSVLWYFFLAIVFSSAMRGRTFATARITRQLAAGAVIAVGVAALWPA